MIWVPLDITHHLSYNIAKEKHKQFQNSSILTACSPLISRSNNAMHKSCFLDAFRNNQVIQLVYDTGLMSSPQTALMNIRLYLIGALFACNLTLGGRISVE